MLKFGKFFSRFYLFWIYFYVLEYINFLLQSLFCPIHFVSFNAVFLEYCLLMPSQARIIISWKTHFVYKIHKYMFLSNCALKNKWRNEKPEIHTKYLFNFRLFVILRALLGRAHARAHLRGTRFLGVHSVLWVFFPKFFGRFIWKNVQNVP